MEIILFNTELEKIFFLERFLMFLLFNLLLKVKIIFFGSLQLLFNLCYLLLEVVHFIRVKWHRMLFWKTSNIILCVCWRCVFQYLIQFYLRGFKDIISAVLFWQHTGWKLAEARILDEVSTKSCGGFFIAGTALFVFLGSYSFPFDVRLW